jgi:hypothetical protein
MLRQYHAQAPEQMSGRGGHTPMDIATNSVITIQFSRGLVADFGFTVKNSSASSTRHMSSSLIIPIVNSVQITSEAARVGLRSGMRIIGVGKTTIRPCRSMPSSITDYSPARHCTQMIIDAIHSSTTVKIRVDDS